MDTFTVRDLRERTGQLIHDAEEGKLSLVTKHGTPVFLALPFTQDLLESGLKQALAIKLFQEHVTTLGKAAKLAGLPLEAFITKLGYLGIAAVDYAPSELEEELKDFE
jgi:predicted HTH domain antitoxin